MKLSALKTDVAKLEAGQWVGDIPDMENLELHVRGLGNTDYKRLFEKKADAVPRARKVRGLQTEDRDRIVGECLHEAVLIDWRGLKNDDGTCIAFDSGLAFDLVSKPEFAKFRAAVVWAANLVSEEAGESVEASAKNRRKPSAGISPGVRRRSGCPTLRRRKVSCRPPWRPSQTSLSTCRFSGMRSGR